MKRTRRVQYVFDPATGTLKRQPIPVADPRNRLNDLVANDWVQSTKSWFISDGKPTDISRGIRRHPASFPPAVVRRFIEFFTKWGQWVLDPFLGTGTTLVACEKTGRNGVGIELYEKYAVTARSRTTLKVIQGDAREILHTLDQKFHLCISSPPYWSILNTKGSHKQKARAKGGLDLYYGKDAHDLGGVADYGVFVRALIDLYDNIGAMITDKGHLVIIVQNPYHKGTVYPLAFDLVQELRQIYAYLGEVVWCQDQKALKPYGYPYTFVPNIHHHYCLVFRKE